MKVAVIADVHSNFPAIESVLSDIERKNVDSILCAGDLVGYASFPNEVINLLRKTNILTIQGNYDEAIGNQRLICGCDYKDEKQMEMAGLSMRFTNEAIRPENREYLKQLPQKLTLKIGGLKMRMVHGSPRRINEYLFKDSFQVEEVAKELSEDILVCGHTHIPYYKVINGKHIINAGSAGKPKHGNANATYVILDVADEKINVTIHEVPYDVEKTVSAIVANNVLPNEFGEMLRKG